MGLAALGHDLVLLGRDEVKLKSLVEELQRTAPSARLSYFRADLASVRDTAAVAERIRASLTHLDVLVNNAGAIHEARVETPEGLELTFALNHMSYFTLTLGLLDLLKATPSARVVSVASDLHRRGRIEFDDIHSSTRYSGLKAYTQSKLANVLFSSELARRLQGSGVTSNSLHPGVVATGFGHNNRGFIKWWVSLTRPFLKTPTEAAKTTIHVATSPELGGVTGAYFKDCRQLPASTLARDPAVARQLWALSEELLTKCLRGDAPDRAPFGRVLTPLSTH
jgi:NAD(P)-dependent dehydrogenase (short-subunit alcohol dehydrogenase family)